MPSGIKNSWDIRDDRIKKSPKIYTKRNPVRQKQLLGWQKGDQQLRFSRAYFFPKIDLASDQRLATLAVKASSGMLRPACARVLVRFHHARRQMNNIRCPSMLLMHYERYTTPDSEANEFMLEFSYQVQAWQVIFKFVIIQSGSWCQWCNENIWYSLIPRSLN